MQLKEDWKLIIKKAWSVRLVAVGTVFTTAQLVLPIYGDFIDKDVFAVLTIVCCVGAIVLRLFTQKNMPNVL